MDEQAVDIAIRVISSLGFPIFVAVWLLLRTDTILREVRDLLKEVKTIITTKIQ